MRRHPGRSADILREARGVAPAVALQSLLTHHERWDGSGYPAGLAGDAIPYEGRVLALADAFSAMTVERAHRSRLPVFDALTEMASTRGQFDPRLLRVLVLMVGGGGDS
jgi:putative two-component system response regulator